MVSFRNIPKYSSGKEVIMMPIEMNNVGIVNGLEHKISCNTSKVWKVNLMPPMKLIDEKLFLSWVGIRQTQESCIKYLVKFLANMLIHAKHGSYVLDT